MTYPITLIYVSTIYYTYSNIQSLLNIRPYNVNSSDILYLIEYFKQLYKLFIQI
jgi:hypothetical protein